MKGKVVVNIFGFLIYMSGIAMYTITFKELIFFSTDYYLFGDNRLVKIESVVRIDNDYQYICIDTDSKNKPNKLYSCKTGKIYIENQMVTGMVSPNFNKIMFGHISVVGYAMSMFMLLFLLFCSGLIFKQAFLRISPINNSESYTPVKMK